MITTHIYKRRTAGVHGRLLFEASCSKQLQVSLQVLSSHPRQGGQEVQRPTDPSAHDARARVSEGQVGREARRPKKQSDVRRAGQPRMEVARISRVQDSHLTPMVGAGVGNKLQQNRSFCHTCFVCSFPLSHHNSMLERQTQQRKFKF